MSVAEVIQKKKSKSRPEIDLWQRVAVVWEFTTWLCASLPNDMKAIANMEKARSPQTKPPDARDLDSIAQEVIETTLTEERVEGEPIVNVFQQLDFPELGRCLAVRMATVRAHLKESAKKISKYYSGKVEGESSFAVKAMDNLYYPMQVEYIPILDSDGNPIREPDGQHVKPVHFMTMRGPESAIKTFDYVDRPMLYFELWLGKTAKDKSIITEKDLERIMMHGGTKGYAGERSDGKGRYVYRLEYLEGAPTIPLATALEKWNQFPPQWWDKVHQSKPIRKETRNGNEAST